MKLEYSDQVVGQEIDLDKLRPGQSYDYLIKNRNASIQSVLDDPIKIKEYLNQRHCPNCESDEHAPYAKKDNLDIVQCKHCDLVYVNPVFDEERYLNLYKSEDYQKVIKQLGQESHDYRRNRFGAERVDAIEKTLASNMPKKLLEIGCSTGFVLEEANARGWETTGLELNPAAATFGQEKGINIQQQTIQDFANKTSGKFSAIALYDVLEHLINPKEIMLMAKELLLPNGCIFIYVPNLNSASVDLLGHENAHFIWPTHHLTYFNPVTLNHFLDNLGFEVIHWETQGLDIADWLWFKSSSEKADMSAFTPEVSDLLQYYINASGHGKNLRMYARKK